MSQLHHQFSSNKIFKVLSYLWIALYLKRENSEQKCYRLARGSRTGLNDPACRALESPALGKCGSTTLREVVTGDMYMFPSLNAWSLCQFLCEAVKYLHYRTVSRNKPIRRKMRGEACMSIIIKLEMCLLVGHWRCVHSYVPLSCHYQYYTCSSLLCTYLHIHIQDANVLYTVQFLLNCGVYIIARQGKA
jgi:hypothetical protein